MCRIFQSKEIIIKKYNSNLMIIKYLSKNAFSNKETNILKIRKIKTYYRLKVY